MCGRRSSAARIFYPAKCAWWFEIRYPHLSKRPNVKTAFLPPYHFFACKFCRKVCQKCRSLEKTDKICYFDCRFCLPILRVYRPPEMKHTAWTATAANRRAAKKLREETHEKTTFERKVVLALVQVHRLLSNPTHRIFKCLRLR